jgi:putative flavoprotein involved in K+ transport
MQLVGHNDPARSGGDLDLATLQRQGVELVGHLDDVHRLRAHFRDDLAGMAADADRRMNRVLDVVDRHVEQTGLSAEVWPAVRPRPLSIPRTTAKHDLRAEGIGTVVVATGYRPDHSWLRLPITAPDGSIRQYRGVTPASGIYVVGQKFQHRRDSSSIDGVRHDARAVVAHLCGSSDAAARAAEATAG